MLHYILVSCSPVQGSVVTSPLLDADVTVTDPEGHLTLHIPEFKLAEGPVPICVAQTLPGGESETVAETYPIDPYETNVVTLPPFRLVTLSDLKVTGEIGVLSPREDVLRVVGDLKDAAIAKRELGSITPMADGSSWWVSNLKGIGLKTRVTPGAAPADKNPALLVERVRLFKPDAGSIGGVSAEMPWNDALDQLGDPQVERDERTPSDALMTSHGDIASYLDGGLRICHDENKVLWLEIARPDALLENGTTTFVRRPQARLYVEEFVGNPNTNLHDAEDLKAFLAQIGSVQIVASRDQADLILSGRVSQFEEDIDKAQEDFDERLAPEVLRQIPDPATGMSEGRAWVQFPEVPLVSETQVSAATEQVEADALNAPDVRYTGLVESDPDDQITPEYFTTYGGGWGHLSGVLIDVHHDRGWRSDYTRRRDQYRDVGLQHWRENRQRDGNRARPGTSGDRFGNGGRRGDGPGRNNGSGPGGNGRIGASGNGGNRDVSAPGNGPGGKDDNAGEKAPSRRYGAGNETGGRGNGGNGNGGRRNNGGDGIATPAPGNDNGNGRKVIPIPIPPVGDATTVPGIGNTDGGRKENGDGNGGRGDGNGGRGDGGNGGNREGGGRSNGTGSGRRDGNDGDSTPGVGDGNDGNTPVRTGGGGRGDGNGRRNGNGGNGNGGGGGKKDKKDDDGGGKKKKKGK